jgi:hypothetical protein
LCSNRKVMMNPAAMIGLVSAAHFPAPRQPAAARGR